MRVLAKRLPMSLGPASPAGPRDRFQGAIDWRHRLTAGTLEGSTSRSIGSCRSAVLGASVRLGEPDQHSDLARTGIAFAEGTPASIAELLGHQLDRPWIKSRIVRLAKESAGLSIDYAGMRVSVFDGVRAKSLRIFTPELLAAGAETLLNVEDARAVSETARVWDDPDSPVYAFVRAYRRRQKPMMQRA